MQMKRVLGLMTAVTVLTVGGALVRAEHVIKLGDTQTLTIGADVRARLDHYDRDAYNIDRDAFANRRAAPFENGPAVQYLRMRERVWGKLELAPDVFFQARAVNRWHYYSSRQQTDNNSGKAGYEAPDEVIFDNFYFNWGHIGESDWSVRLGRQDIVLGNGMVLLEGTPMDAGRTIYFDGVVTTWEPTERDTVKFLALYDTYKDETVVINDRNRRLRRGDTLVLGTYYTHKFSKAFNADLYYLYVNIDDPELSQDGAGRDRLNVAMSVPGIRLFGAPHALFDYSAELAKQFGECTATSGRGANVDRDAEMGGWMGDLRLGFKTCDGTPLSPKLNLEYTYMSGDDNTSMQEFEGWHPVFAEYPIWREELIPNLNRGNWTNLHQPRAEVQLQLAKDLKLTTAYAVMIADYQSGGTGGGSHIGDVASLFVDYKVNKYLNFSLQVAEFFPGNYYRDGHNTEWVRFETTITF
jgi:hypothetical protein